MRITPLLVNLVLLPSNLSMAGSGPLKRAKQPAPSSTAPAASSSTAPAASSSTAPAASSSAATPSGSVPSGTSGGGTVGGETKVKSCQTFFASALGSKGFISEDGKFYYQLYNLEKKGNSFRQAFEEIELATLKHQDLLAFNLPLIDMVSYDRGANAEGVSFVTFDSNKDDCYSGASTMVSIPIERNSLSDKSVIRRDQGKVTSFRDLNAFWNFYDITTKSLIELSYNPFLKRRLSFPSDDNQRIIFIGKGKIKRPFVALKYRDSKDPKSVTELISYDLNGVKSDQIGLGENEKVLMEASGTIGTMTFEKKGLNFEVKELKGWGSGNRDQLFKARFPVGFLPSQANYLVHFQKRIIVGYPVSGFFKTRWPSVIIFDYETAKEIGRISFKDGVVGQVSMNRDATQIVAEEIDGATLVRKSLVLYDLTSKKMTMIRQPSEKARRSL